jgi:hypothetical protein
MLKRRAVHSLAALVAGLLFAPPTVVAQAPTLARLSPTGGAPGSTVDVTLYGGNLAGATRIWTSFPATATLPTDIENNGTQADHVVFRLEIPQDAPLGVGGIRVATDKGVSEVRLFVVDDLPNVAEAEPNNSPGEPQAIPVPSAVSGSIDAEQFDYFKIEARAGQSLAFEVLARRLGSPMDPMARLLDLAGRELAYNDDAGGIGSDCRFAYTFDKDGEYLIEIRDIRFQGSANHIYRLRVGDFPVATVPYPMGGRRGSEIEVELAGTNVAGAPARKLKVPEEPMVEQVCVGAKRAGGQSSALLDFDVTDTPEVLEAEPNNLPDQATRAMLPGSLNGRLQHPGDRDYWAFSAKKGQRFVFEGITRRLGSPTDLYLTLTNAQGGQVAAADDTGKADGLINYTFPADGEYRLIVEDLNLGGGPEHAYRIVVRPYQPGFVLTPNVQKADVPQGGVVPITITVARQDYNGPITLSADGLPEGVAASNSVIGPGQKQTFLTLAANADAAPGQLAVCRVWGTAEINGQKVTHQLDMTDLLRGALSNIAWPPQPLTRLLAAGVGPKPFFTLRSESPTVVVGRNTAAKITVKASRAEDFKEQIALKADGLPGKVTAEIKPVEKEQDTAEITIKAAADAPLGVYTILVTGTGKRGDQQLAQPAPAINVDVRQAYELSADVGEGKLARGGKVEVKVKAVRHGDFAGAINFELRNLPAGVTTEGELVVPEGQSEVAIQLVAADDAQVGAVQNLTVVGKASVGGADQEVAAPAVTLNVLEKQ